MAGTCGHSACRTIEKTVTSFDFFSIESREANLSARDLPPLKALRAFEAVGRHRSITRAADELNVTPGAVSRQVQSLEGWLGTALLVRGHRSIDLTDAGRRYLDEIGAALAQIANATRPFLKAAQKRPLRICSYPTFTQRWLIQRWKEFNRAHPEIGFEFSTSLMPLDDPADEFDARICLGHESERWDGWEALHLYRVEMIPVCAPSLAQGNGGTIGTGDLGNFSLIRGAPRPDDWARWLKENGVTGVDPASGPMFENFNLAMQAAIEGAGILLADKVLAADDLAAGRLVQPFGPGRRSRHAFYFVMSRQKASDQRLKLFADWLKETVAATGT